MRLLLGRYDKVVLVSEELSSANNHKGLRLLCGLDHENVLQIIHEAKERFSRADEGVLVVQMDGQKSAWRGRDPASDFLQEFVTLTGENLLCLCPSYRVIRDLRRTITRPLEEKGIAVFSQGIDGGPTIAGHLSEPNTVVLSRFGVEIPASATGGSKVLVIPKRPFAPPNTVDDLRRKELSALGEDGFVQVNVLPAVFWIRSYIAIQNQIHKRSSVVLLDPKILPGVRGWGQSFSDAMIDIDKIVCLPHEAISRIGAWVKTE